VTMTMPYFLTSLWGEHKCREARLDECFWKPGSA
jgi:hypothetical protein